MQRAEIEQYLHRHIPVSKAMEVGVVAVDDAGVRLRAPLAANINHRSTAFGGSASALAILSAWTLVHVRLREAGHPSQVVIQRNWVEYLRPIHEDFEAFCPAPPPAEWERFQRSMVRRGRGRIELEASLLAGGEVTGTYRGVYVAMRGDPE